MDKDDAFLLVKLNELQQTERIFEGWEYCLHEFRAESYEDFTKKYSSPSHIGFKSFYAVSHFLELCGVLVKYDLLSEDLFFDTFYFEPIWKNFEPVIKSMRKRFNEDSLMENFENLFIRYLDWKKNHHSRTKRRN